MERTTNTERNVRKRFTFTLWRYVQTALMIGNIAAHNVFYRGYGYIALRKKQQSVRQFSYSPDMTEYWG